MLNPIELKLQSNLAAAGWIPETLASFGKAKLGILCRETGFGADEPSIAEVFDTLIHPWGQQSLAIGPQWPSDISDDHTPYEFSIAYEGGRSELRMLVEPQAASTNLETSWQAGLELGECLQKKCKVSLRRFEQVKDLFQPGWDRARFSIWFAACCRRGEPPDFKMYLNPQCGGPEQASFIVKEALDRLGFAHAWTLLHRVLDCNVANRLTYFSLDLSDKAAARVKIYIAHPNAMASEVDSAMTLAGPVYEPGMAQHLSRLWVGHDGPFDRRPLLSCYAFTSASDLEPLSATFHFPIRNYVVDDQIAVKAVQRVLPPAVGLMHQAAIEEFAGRPLAADAGLQSYFSVRKHGGEMRTTVYLSAEAYPARAPAESPIS